MAYKQIDGGLTAPKGFKAAGVHADIRPNTTKKDMMLLVSDVPAAAAAMYTQNKVKGAPILVCQQHLANGVAQAVLCNSGNANTCAPGGFEFAKWSCEAAAQATGLAPEDFVVASTGVIGQALAREPFETGIPALVKALSETGGEDAAEAMMTTDTVKKSFAVEFELGGKTCRLGAAAKGSGMININMATMLCFVTTDAAIAPDMLQTALADTVSATLNQVTVDGDTSTNDTCAILANGLCGNSLIISAGEDYTTFCGALANVLTRVAKALAADGEGATKLLECVVSGAPDDKTVRAIAKTVIGSDLFKAAMFGADANWGRVLCAIGYTPGDFAVDDISVTLQSDAGSVLVCRHSTHHEYSEEEASRILARPAIQILVDMHQGDATATAWGCDLTYDYVKINGDYRS